MTPISRLHRACLRTPAGLSLALLLALPPAQALTNPPIQRAPQGVEFMCGGHNDAERAFMERVSPRWGATLEFAVSGAPRGQFAETVQFRVKDSYHGQEVMQAQADGPYLVARLNPGTYEVEATLGTLTLTQTLVVRLGAPARALFLWPSNFDIAAATLASRTLAQAPLPNR